MIALEAREEIWPIAGRFTISRGAKTEARVIVVTARSADHSGRGEAVPYARYGETVEGALAAIRALGAVRDRTDLAGRMPAGAARNAVDCALWDLEAKSGGAPAYVRAGLPPILPVTTCYTLSLDTPEAMAAKAREVAHLPLLKLKLGGPHDAERMAAVRDARPDARLVADANEGWAPADVERLLEVASRERFELIEQPLPSGDDHALSGMTRPVPVCADESLHTAHDLPALAGRYDAVNIKLDKTGGLTAALALSQTARAHGLKIMVGCMVATSLAMAPALLVAQGADWVDLDGPLLLARDRTPGLDIRDGVIAPPSPVLWG